ncbi:MAG TPA: ribonuclease PH [Alphaproteobacteria bacterium]|nr:ribonuclease PH [Alphaproteobacteria bacterium]
MRPNNRSKDSLREIKIEINVSDYAEGSCLISYGKTKVLCTASLDEFVPPFLRNTGKGWVTAEYGMLPRSTHTRMPREAAKGKQSGRTVEIQRLIGRSLRAVIDLKKLGEKQIIVDCDVINADGGTRTASITGGFVALYLACKHMEKKRQIKEFPITNFVAAVSAGIHNNAAILDLEYEEDSDAEVDANFVITGNGKMVELGFTGEESSFTEEQMNQMLALGKKGVAELIEMQKNVISHNG